MKRHLITATKICIPIGILSWLLIKESDAIQRLVSRPKDLRLLLASLACMLMATCMSFTRWFLLVRALEIPFTVREAFRLGFLGYLLNFVGPGAVGGDLFKAYYLAREQTERRAEAVATILLDRMVGLFSLFLVATCTILFAGAAELDELGDFLRLVTWLTAVGVMVVVLLLLPDRFSNWLFAPMTRLPWIGGVVVRIKCALDLYRQRRSWLLAIGTLGILIHLLIAVAMHFMDRSVNPLTPELSEHLIISPLATVASAAPVPGGLGTYELAMDYLFQKLPARTMERGQGLAVAVIYRLQTVLIAGIGIVYYTLNRRSVSETVSAIQDERRQAMGQADQT